MKKHFINVLSIMLLLTSVVVMNSCSEDEDPSNVISDSEGVEINLEWNTGGSDDDAKSDADLDLLVYDNDEESVGYSGGYSFEKITFKNMDDGTYFITVRMFTINHGGDFTISVNGINVSKKWDFDSSFSTSDEDDEVSFVKIVKSGSKYTLTAI